MLERLLDAEASKPRLVLTGVGALCFGWWLPGVILIVGGGAPAGAVLCASSLSARWSDR
jgi:hypothetical protein